MKRQALKLLVFLVAGAIINVAVAWTFAFRDPAVVRDSARHFERSGYPKTARQTSIYVAKGEFRVHQISGSRTVFWLDNPEFISESEYQALLPGWSVFNGTEPAVAALKEDEDHKFVDYFETAFGWPHAFVALHNGFLFRRFRSKLYNVYVSALVAWFEEFARPDKPSQRISVETAAHRLRRQLAEFWNDVLGFYRDVGACASPRSHQTRSVCGMRVFAARQYQRGVSRVRLLYSLSLWERAG